MTDRVVGVLIAAFGLVVAAVAWRFPAIPGQVVGPSVFPTAIGLGLAVCGTLLTVGAAARQVPAEPPAWRQQPRLLVDFALVVGMLVFFTVALDPLGFLPTSFVCLAVLLFAFGANRRWLVPIALVVTVAIHYAFYTLLRVPLPWGVLSSVAW